MWRQFGGRDFQRFVVMGQEGVAGLALADHHGPTLAQSRSAGSIASPQDGHGRVSAMEYVVDKGVSPDPTDAADLAPEHCVFLAKPGVADVHLLTRIQDLLSAMETRACRRRGHVHHRCRT